MLEIANWKVYDLRETVIACRNAMRTEMPQYDSEEEFAKGMARAVKLVKAGGGSGETSFRKGIRVAMDVKYTQYITKQMQRYHWFDFVSSSSLMHRLTYRRVSENCNEYVTWAAVNELQKWVDVYNGIAGSAEFKPCVFTTREREIHCDTKQDALYVAYMFCISNCPMGYELFTRVTTNYEQLATMYRQRKHHKLKEDWGAFCRWVEQLPYAKELIIGCSDKEDEGK